MTQLLDIAHQPQDIVVELTDGALEKVCFVSSGSEAVEAAGPESIIAFVLEPVGGTSTGARLLGERYLKGIRSLCNEFGCLMILDEVLTGVGRTRIWFAFQHYGVVPDLLANWKIPGKFSPGIGGAMELAQKIRRLVMLCSHNDKQGNPKILERCRLPLTASGCVSRIITDKAVIDVTPAGLAVVEIAEGLDPADLQAATEAPLLIDESLLGRF